MSNQPSVAQLNLCDSGSGEFFLISLILFEKATVPKRNLFQIKWRGQMMVNIVKKSLKFKFLKFLQVFSPLDHIALILLTFAYICFYYLTITPCWFVIVMVEF